MLLGPKREGDCAQDMTDSPSLIFWEFTKACNLGCAYCRVLKHGKGAELDTKEAMDMASNIKGRFSNALLILSGGEPFLRKDLFDVLSHAFSLGLKTSLATNGTLVDREKALRLKGCGVKRVSITLDSRSEEKHDRSRSVQGSYKKALDAISILKGEGIPVQINFTVTKSTKDEIVDMAELSRLLGVTALHYFVLVPVGCGMELKEAEMLSPLETDKALSMIEKVSRDFPIEVRPTCAPQYVRFTKDLGYGGCLAGNKVFFISSEGDIYPCGYLPIKAGSVREQDIGAIWRNSYLFNSLREFKVKGRCSRCSLKKRCGGCRARAYSLTGDYLAGDETCGMVPGTILKTVPGTKQICETIC